MPPPPLQILPFIKPTIFGGDFPQLSELRSLGVLTNPPSKNWVNPTTSPLIRIQMANCRPDFETVTSTPVP